MHNHQPSEDARVHPRHSEHDAAATEIASVASLQELIEALAAAVITAGTARANLLQADPGSLVIPQDIAT